MDNFLYNIAKVYYEHHASEIQDFTFVFPNRRAGLFFQKYLGEIAEKPLFSPKITTINQVFTDLSRFQTADRMGMLFRLFDIYKELKAAALTAPPSLKASPQPPPKEGEQAGASSSPPSGELEGGGFGAWGGCRGRILRRVRLLGRIAAERF